MRKKKWNIKKYKYHKPERVYKPFTEITNEGLLIKQYNPLSKRYELLASFLCAKNTISADKISVGDIWRNGR